MPRLIRTVIVFSVLLLFSNCQKDGGGNDSTNNDAPVGEEVTETEGSIPNPSAEAGQILLSVPENVDPESVKGYVVGESTELTLERSGEQYYIDGVPPGDHDVIVTGALAVSALTQANADRGIRINDISVEAGSAKNIGDVDLPKMGKLSGVALLAQPDEVSDHARIVSLAE